MFKKAYQFSASAPCYYQKVSFQVLNTATLVTIDVLSFTVKCNENGNFCDAAQRPPSQVMENENELRQILLTAKAMSRKNLFARHSNFWLH